MIHLEVLVANTEDLLDAEAYGAGALLRWESSATVGGIYTEGDTIALVSGTSVYDVWDAAGVEGTTWYRTRISDSGAGTTFSAYSTPFQTAAHGMPLSVSQFRAFNPAPDLTDEALLILLDAAAEAIVAEIGYPGATTDRFRPRGPLLMLSRPALSITSVTEDDTALAADDYELSPSGRILRRLDDGTSPRSYWYGWVDVAYLPRDDTATRQRVQRELVALDISHQPGLSSQSIGTWSETYSSGSTYAQQRSDILASLVSGVGFL